MKLSTEDIAFAEDFRRLRDASRASQNRFRAAELALGKHDGIRPKPVQQSARVVMNTNANRCVVEVRVSCVDAAREVENGNVAPQRLADDEALSHQRNDYSLKRSDLGGQAANVKIFQSGILRRLCSAFNARFPRGAQ